MATQNLDQIKDKLMYIDRYMKAGRFTFSLLTADNKNLATMHELILDYGTDNNGNAYGTTNGFPTDKDGKVKVPRPSVFVINENGERVNVETESAIQVRKFLDNFFEVSTQRTKFGEPSMWLKLIANDDGTTTYGEKNTRDFYEYVRNNKDQLVPYIMQTFKDGKRDILIPFITADHVFYDVSKIIAGEKIRSIDGVFSLIHSMVNRIGENLRFNIATIEERMNNTLEMLKEKADIHDRAIAALQKNINDMESYYIELKTKITDIMDKVGKTFIKKGVFVKRGEILKLKFNPSKKGFKPAIDGFEKAADIYSSCLFITGQINTAEIFVEIGPGSHIGFDKIAFFMDKNTSHEFSQPNMRIAQVGSAMPDNIISFAEQAATGEYIIQFNYDIGINVWTKYIDYMEIETAIPPEEAKRIMNTVQANRSRMNDIGVLPIYNSVVCRTSTTFLNKGLALGDNCILVAGDHKYNNLKEFDYRKTVDSSWTPNKTYEPVREQLAIATDNIVYDQFNRRFEISCGYWRPGMSFDIMVYNTTHSSTRLTTADVPNGIFKTASKPKLSAAEVARGIMTVEVNFGTLIIEEGWLYELVASAPGYISSLATRGSFKFKR